METAKNDIQFKSNIIFLYSKSSQPSSQVDLKFLMSLWIYLFNSFNCVVNGSLLGWNFNKLGFNLSLLSSNILSNSSSSKI